MGKKIAGTCFVKVNGEQLEVTGGVEVPIADVNREVVMGVAGVAGYKETAKEPFVKVTAAFVPGFPIATLQSGTDMTVTAELANGKVYTLSGAFLKGEPTVKNDDGTVDLEFSGDKGLWQ